MSFRTGATATAPVSLSSDGGANENPTDSISQVAWSPTADVLAVSSWDNKVRLYEVDQNGNALKRAEYNHQAPVLGCAWTPDGTKALSGGCDNAVRAYDLQSGQALQIGAHDQPVKSVCGVTINGGPIVASASWDETLKYWDTRQQAPVATVKLSNRAVNMCTLKNLLVVACIDQKICIIDLNKPDTIFDTRASALRLQTRALACHSDGAGYSVGSIEGRCSIAYVAENQAAQGFAFKCHREPRSPPNRDSEKLYALNSISFHPKHDTFCTAGADGIINFWDKDAKSRLKGTTFAGGSIVSTDFNASGSLLAYGVSYDWSKGHNGNTPGYPTRLSVHVVQEAEVKKKGRR